MAKHVRHIWAKANQHIKVHRRRLKAQKDDNIIYTVVAVIVILWLLS